ncbi:hypothetical protein F4802DRAFT_565688 [Xylaria palmicola]|nr:hypothetical protein F4802DRAFT_565688 [Xylaria palmicola]
MRKPSRKYAHVLAHLPNQMRSFPTACVAGRVVESHQTLKSARMSTPPPLAKGEEPMSRAMTETAKDLASMFYKAGDEKSCNAVVDEVVASLEARLCISTLPTKTSSRRLA